MIINEKCLDFLANDMKLCLKDIKETISSLDNQYQEFYSELVQLLCTLNLPYEYNDPGSYENEENRIFINKKLFELRSFYGLKEDTMEYPIFDSVRHAYVAYREGGVLQLYKGREAETWYPKVVIDGFIGDEADIAELNDTIEIYRGTSIEEYNSSSYGQSWTLDENIAEQFAYRHYAGQSNYSNTIRVVLKITIEKEHIYYFTNDDNEQEVIIDNRKIKKDLVIKVSEKISE